MNKLGRYKWTIIGYILYVIFILFMGCRGFRWDKHWIWLNLLIMCVAFPLIGYTVVHILKRFFFTSKSSNKPNCPIINVTFNTSVPLVDFAKAHGAMKILRRTDGLTGQVQTTECLFTTADGTETHAWVANNIKDYSAEDISKNKDRLYIMTMPSGDYCLCIPWEDVDLSC